MICNSEYRFITFADFCTLNFQIRMIDRLETTNRELKETLAQKEESLMNLSSEKILTEV